jgi:hypothetical protein
VQRELYDLALKKDLTDDNVEDYIKQFEDEYKKKQYDKYKYNHHTKRIRFNFNFFSDECIKSPNISSSDFYKIPLHSAACSIV